MDELSVPEELLARIKEWHQRLGVPVCYPIPIRDKHGNETGRYTLEKEPLPETACSIAADAYQAWTRYRSALRKMVRRFPHKDFHGSYARLPEIAMRMAVLMASLENNHRIELRHWAKAQELAELLRKNLHQLYWEVNCSTQDIGDTAQLENRILEKMTFLASKGVDGITVAQMKGSYFKTRSHEEIQRVMNAMTKAGVLSITHTAHARAGKYSLAREESEGDA